MNTQSKFTGWDFTDTWMVSSETYNPSVTLQFKGERYTLPECVFKAPSGKEFDKWSIDGTAYVPGQSLTVTSDLTVTAVWKDAAVIPGDVNGDGNVNMQDYALLQRWLANWKVEINYANADMNGDGIVNMQDYALLQRMLAG